MDGHSGGSPGAKTTNITCRYDAAKFIYSVMTAPGTRADSPRHFVLNWVIRKQQALMTGEGGSYSGRCHEEGGWLEGQVTGHHFLVHSIKLDSRLPLSMCHATSSPPPPLYISRRRQVLVLLFARLCAFSRPPLSTHLFQSSSRSSSRSKSSSSSSRSSVNCRLPPCHFLPFRPAALLAPHPRVKDGSLPGAVPGPKAK